MALCKNCGKEWAVPGCFGWQKQAAKKWFEKNGTLWNGGICSECKEEALMRKSMHFSDGEVGTQRDVFDETEQVDWQDKIGYRGRDRFSGIKEGSFSDWKKYLDNCSTDQDIGVRAKNEK